MTKPASRSTTRRDLLVSLAAATVGCSWLRKQQAHIITPSYGAFRGEHAERVQALKLLDVVLDEESRRGVAGTRAAQLGIAALAQRIRDRSIEPHAAIHNDDSGGTLVVDAADHDRLVVFSDHHLGPSTHRHNVFSGPGGRHYRHCNHGLYEAVLRRYYQGDFTLVENGDVEDLVVFDPSDHPGEYRYRHDRLSQLRPEERPGELARLREQFRGVLLAETLADPRNRAYYQILARFDAEGRLFRLAGNHDYPRRRMWDEAVAFAEHRLAEADFPSTDRFGVVLALQRGASWETVILHGHQFDHSSSPLNAAVHGETISECLGIWYQGADRIWPWSEWCEQWCAGRPFSNRLVSGTPLDNDALRRTSARRSPYAIPHAIEARQRLWAHPAGPGWFERVFEHPVAWEYLQRPADEEHSAVVGVFRAVASGEAWFKYRHTEEIELAGTLPELVGGRPPNVVLGHTHEPRACAIDAFGEPVDWYFNSAATGRFEGLIWAVEILGGEPRVVSWHADPFPNGRPVRRVWFAGGRYRELLFSRVEELA